MCDYSRRFRQGRAARTGDRLIAVRTHRVYGFGSRGLFLPSISRSTQRVSLVAAATGSNRSLSVFRHSPNRSAPGHLGVPGRPLRAARSRIAGSSSAGAQHCAPATTEVRT